MPTSVPYTIGTGPFAYSDVRIKYFGTDGNICPNVTDFNIVVTDQSTSTVLSSFTMPFRVSSAMLGINGATSSHVGLHNLEYVITEPISGTSGTANFVQEIKDEPCN